MSQVITNEILNTELQAFLQKLAVSVYSYDYAFYKCLYDHGFRLSEMFTLHESTIDHDNIVTVKTLKNSLDRLIPLKQFPEVIQQSIITHTNKFFFHKEDHYNRTFKQYFRFKSVQIQDKPITTHLFRHNFARQEYLRTRSVVAVKNKMGLTSDQVCISYIFSNIYY